MTDSALIGLWVSTILTCLAGILLLVMKHLHAGSIFILLGLTTGAFSSLVLWKVKGITVVHPVTSIIALLSSLTLLTTVIITLF